MDSQLPAISLIRLPMYKADCGHTFRKRPQAESHIKTCWKSPSLRTCKTCRFGRYNRFESDTGDGDFWECRNPKFDEETDFTAAHERVPTLCVRCPKWESRQS